MTMRLSCNGCRVLRKRCGDSCSIRPCLQWIKSPEAQSNATVFLAKFYGRAGLLNLVDAGGVRPAPAVFRSLLYEACGRIVNPIYGAVGLLWSGKWHMCQAAVEAVLNGQPIVSDHDLAVIASEKAYDIRHVDKIGIVKKKRASADNTTTCRNNNKRPKLQASSEHQQQQEQEASAAAGVSLLLDNDSDDAEVEVGSHVSQSQAQHNQPEQQVDEEDEQQQQQQQQQQQSTHNHNQQEQDEAEQLIGLDLALGLAPTSDSSSMQCSTRSALLPP